MSLIALKTKIRGVRVRIVAMLLWGLAFNTVPLSRLSADDLTDTFLRGLSAPTLTQEGSLIGLFRETPSGELELDLAGESLGAAARSAARFAGAAVAQSVTQQFPLASVSPAFIYRYNPALTVYERATNVPGPLFSERALTLGKGQFNVSVGYSFVDFSSFNGADLDRLGTPGLLFEVFEPSDFGQLPSGEFFATFPVALSQLRTRIDLHAHLAVPAVRYGITDNWDIGLAIPVVNTFLRVRSELRRVAETPLSAVVSTVDGNISIGRFVDPTTGDELLINQLGFGRSQRRSLLLRKAAGSATGVGDISVRSKYRFWQREEGGAALGVNLLLPSGEIRDFQGADETHVSTFFYLSHIFIDRIEPHLNVGVDFNTDDVDRSSFLYAVGVSVLVTEKLGLSMDFIGRSDFARFPIDARRGTIVGATLDRAPETCTESQPCFLSGTRSFLALPVKFPRNTIVDCAFGVRYALGKAGSVFFGMIVPLNDDGLRPDFIPAGGVEYTF